ncbi:hypothetical protein Kpho02_03370 [Kitasatospora phosalacinea]|uniref:Uncharacterized protein n=1 Tax=Kitasatospora phosalacinea TaxID=2065 RepID=A0A9W6Q3U7_9ACTN|nr:hypothetical protein Kpho02_03370 [Kitasatospora phosalacinea]
MSICGWVDCCEDEQLRLLRGIAAAERAGERDYRGGWTFPTEQPMWGRVAFFAADGRAGYEDRVREVLERVAALPAVDQDDRVRGLFRVSHEVDGATEWRLRRGELLCVPAPPEYDYLDE